LAIGWQRKIFLWQADWILCGGVLAIVLLGVIFLAATHEKVPLDQLRGTALEALRISSRNRDRHQCDESAHSRFSRVGERRRSRSDSTRRTLRFSTASTRSAASSQGFA